MPEELMPAGNVGAGVGGLVVVVVDVVTTDVVVVLDWVLVLVVVPLRS